LLVRIGKTKAVSGAPQVDITSSTAQFASRNGPSGLRELKAALDDLGAFVRDLGPLDCLGTITGGRGFEELVPHSEPINDEGIEFRVVDLPTLIGIKRQTGRAKDRVMLPVLIALADELDPE
jgi:hypothetical protein